MLLLVVRIEEVQKCIFYGNIESHKWNAWAKMGKSIFVWLLGDSIQIFPKPTPTPYSQRKTKTVCGCSNINIFYDGDKYISTYPIPNQRQSTWVVNRRWFCGWMCVIVHGTFCSWSLLFSSTQSIHTVHSWTMQVPKWLVLMSTGLQDHQKKQNHLR